MPFFLAHLGDRATNRGNHATIYSRYADQIAGSSALSGGERQILSLARALMAGPRFLLLDEPSAGLSPSMMHDVFDEIAQIRDEQDMCILMVEQNAYEALTVADRAYVLTVGKVAMSAKAVDLLNDPAMEKLYLGGDPDE
ncbi:hypothetical protein B5M07_19030 (plasmid) [Sulfitobacter sp. D7]|nr:hypothetical protein B5M07_19030 [Sulfitobacter sp. D7]